MRFYTNSQDALAAAEVTLADVQDMPRTMGGAPMPNHLPLTEDPFENKDADDVPAPF